MRACPSCAGFLPDHVTACPNCRHVLPVRATGTWHRLRRALLMLAGGVSATVTLAACYGAPPYWDGCADADNDGWLPGCYDDDGTCDPDDRNCDCNDADPSIHPGAVDPIDGVDRDCDGKDTQAPGGPAIDADWTPDADWSPDGGAEP